MLRYTAIGLAVILLVGCQKREELRRDASPAPAVPTASPLDQDNLPAQGDVVPPSAPTSSTPALTSSGQEIEPTDAKLIAELRSRIDTGNLSANARNVQILLRDGQVVLRGPVANAGEKEEVERIVRAYVGNKFTSEIEVPSNPE